LEATATAGNPGAGTEDEIGSACPIADCLRPIRRQRARASGALPETMRVDAVEALATLLDLGGSMALAVELDAGFEALPSGVPASTSGPSVDLVSVIGERFEQLRSAN
jgi:hypothetical protein